MTDRGKLSFDPSTARCVSALACPNDRLATLNGNKVSVCVHLREIFSRNFYLSALDNGKYFSTEGIIKVDVAHKIVCISCMRNIYTVYPRLKRLSTSRCYTCREEKISFLGTILQYARERDARSFYNIMQNEKGRWIFTRDFMKALCAPRNFCSCVIYTYIYIYWYILYRLKITIFK